MDASRQASEYLSLLVVLSYAGLSWGVWWEGGGRHRLAGGVVHPAL